MFVPFNLEPQNHSDEARLRLTLLDGYVPQARPVVNTTNATIVDVGLTIIQVMDLVSAKRRFRGLNVFCFSLARTNKIRS